MKENIFLKLKVLKRKENKSYKNPPKFLTQMIDTVVLCECVEASQ